MTVDGFVVNVDVIRKDGKMLSDIISQLPLVNVKGNVISMAGKSSVIVYLNNHKVYLNGENLVAYLNSLGLENIREIKVLPTPSTKYEADENIGIIAIETKKKTNSGLQSNFLGRGTIGRYLSYGGSAKVLYSGSKVSFETVVLGSWANGFTHSRYTNDFRGEKPSMINLANSLFPQLPKRDGGSGGHVERVHASRHRYLDHVVGTVDGF